MDEASPRLIAFVCLHGSAKSLIAAEYLNRRARGGGLNLYATTSGPEPDAEVPENVIEGLRRRDIDARGRRPELVSAAGLADAVHIVSFGCDLKPLAPAAAVERWDDCPAVSDDFDVAWDFITARVDALMERHSA
jgi:arsenate reductase (thioredoxin)